MEWMTGVEPAASTLARWRPTDRASSTWSPYEESNLAIVVRSHKSGSTGRGMAVPTGFEPAVSSVTGRRVRPDYTTGPRYSPRESNPVHAGKSRAHRQQCLRSMVRREGVEPPVSR